MSLDIDLVATNYVGAAGCVGADANVTDFSLCLPVVVFSVTENTTKFRLGSKSVVL